MLKNSLNGIINVEPIPIHVGARAHKGYVYNFLLFAQVASLGDTLRAYLHAMLVNLTNKI